MIISAFPDKDSEPSGPDPRDKLIASLRASERQARRIVESAIDYAIVGIDLDGIVTSWSAGAHAILGWTEEEAVGQPASMFFTPNDKRHGIAFAEMQLALEDGSASDERWHLKRDGTRFWANGRMMPLLDEAGVVQGFVKILRDRTRERDAGVQQQADAEFLRRVLEASEDCIKVLERDRSIAFISKTGQRLLGLTTPDQLLASDWIDVWQEPFRAEAAEACAAALRGENSAFRGEGPTPGGAHKVWDVRVTPMRDADGTPEKILVVSRDITEHSTTNEALRRTEVHWRSLFERLHEGFVLGELVRDQDRTVVDWRYVEINAAWEALTGLSREATLGSTVREAIPGIDRTWIDTFARVIESGEADTITLHLAQIGRWFECHAYPLEGDRFALLFVDVTEQRRIDGRRAALLALGDLLRDLDDPRDISIAAARIMGHTLGADRAGYGAMDPDGQTLTIENDWTTPGIVSLVGAHAMRGYGSYIDNLLGGEIVAVGDVRLDPRTHANAEALAAIQVAAMIDVPLIEAGQLVAVFFVNTSQPHDWNQEEIGFARTVAERARGAIERCRAEHALRDLAASLERKVEERTRERDQVWQASRDLLCVATLDGYFVSLNPAWSTTLGWSAEALKARPFLDFVHPDDRDGTMAAATGLSQGEAQLGFENRYRCSDGGWRWLSWNAVVRDGLIYATIRDVTEIREQERITRALEEQLRQSQKMEAVGQLTGGIAHDFNNLLTGISGSLELLGTRVAQGRYGEVERHVAAAQGAARRAASLTHRLLAFSRRQTLESRPTDINRLVEEMEELIRRTVGPAIEIVVIGGPELGSAQIDPNQLENALLNLCLNARDAMPDGGRITIATANLTLDGGASGSLAPGDYVSVSVTDTGTGMTPDVIARAFDPFFTTKPIGQGTGLGLSMIYGFVRQSGGEVRIDSTLGRGTSMVLILPRRAGDETRSSPPPIGEDARAAPSPVAAGTVLVVDDEPTVRSFIAEVLTDRGYHVIEAADGQEGLAVLRSEARIDLLVTDVGLPGGMNGRQLADAGRSLRPSLQTLFITGYAEHALVGDGALEPGMHVMTKPFEMDVLAARIAALVDRGIETE